MTMKQINESIYEEKVPFTAIRSPQRTNNHATVTVEGDEETVRELMHILADYRRKMHEQQKEFSYAIIGVKPYPRECVEEGNIADSPSRRHPEEKLSKLKGILDANLARIPEHELETKYRFAYEKIQNEIRELEKSIGRT